MNSCSFKTIPLKNFSRRPTAIFSWMASGLPDSAAWAL